MQEFRTITNSFLLMYANQGGLLDLDLMRSSHNPVGGVTCSPHWFSWSQTQGSICQCVNPGCWVVEPLCCLLQVTAVCLAVAYYFVLGMVILNMLVSVMCNALDKVGRLHAETTRLMVDLQPSTF
jgi:hypothetical protein